jgi:hypothetical protein
MPFGSLWLPVVVSAVAVWLVSAILHMALKYHRADYKKLSDEDAVGQAIRKAAAEPGIYVLPYAMGADMKDPAVQKRYEEGPVALVTLLRSGPPNMMKQLGLWLLFCVLVSFVTSYVARHTLSAASEGLLILRITGTVAFVGYGFGSFVDSIWHGMPWSNALRALVDSLIYGLLTGAIFYWLWPGA